MSTGLSFVLPLAAGGTGRPGDDLERASLLLESFLRCFPKSEVAAFLVVTRLADRDRVGRWLAELGAADLVDVVDESELCPEIAADPDSWSEFPTPNKGWYRQQLLKLGVARRFTTPFYMTLDADVVFTRSFRSADLIRDGRSMINVQQMAHFERWFTPRLAAESRRIRRGRDERSEAILRLRRARECFYGETPVVLARRVVLDLLAHLESAIDGSWERHLLSRRPWTELSLYFTFAEATERYDEWHFDAGPDAVLCMSESLWYAPEEHRDGRSLENWSWTAARRPPSVAVVAQSYLGYDVGRVRSRARELASAS